MSIRTFISHAHEDRRLAREIKEGLSEYGFDCFLAHEDIATGAAWRAKILHALRACQVFIGLLTRHFDKSEWTHQEFGMAYVRQEEVVLLPVRVNVRGRGFFRDFQEIALNNDDVQATCREIAMAVASEHAGIAREIAAALVKRFASVSTYDDAGAVARDFAKLDRTVGLIPVEINSFLRAGTENNQVYGSGSASPHIREVLNRHRGKASRRLLGSFYKVWAYHH